MFDLSHTPVFYVTRDIERALGLPLSTPGFFIISNSTPFAKSVGSGVKNVLLIEGKELLDTFELLQHEKTRQFINDGPHPAKGGQGGVLVFKNTRQIEKICAENNWRLLNPKAELSTTVEEKISQVEWLGDLKKYLPPHQIDIARNVPFDGTPFILQFNRAHTGLGTILIKSETEIKDTQNKFPDRPVRVTKFIDGPMFTNNNVVTPSQILIGNINYQITGLAPFTDQKFSTIGNDFGLPKKILKAKHVAEFREMATAIGEKLRADGWKGLYGIDVIFDPTLDKLFLIEINARQPAGTTYESQLQETKANGQHLTTFKAHIKALLSVSEPNEELIVLEDGAQIIQRVLQTTKNTDEAELKKLESLGLKVIPYTNTTPGADRVRIQSKTSLMESHNGLNTLGKNIADILSHSLSTSALEVIENYLHLPIAGHTLACPYFNNRRTQVRAGLRVLIGKGSVADIVDEVTLFALREKIQLENLSEEGLQKFLVEHNIGIDCSGLVYYILEAELKEKKQESLKKHLSLPKSRNPLRRIIQKLRFIESVGVRTFNDPKNTVEVPLSNARPGDLIVMIGTGKNHDLNHILIIHAVEGNILYYTHSLQWSTDGKYNHGVRQGVIEVIAPTLPLTGQNWEEKGKKNIENETLTRAKSAETISLRRLKILAEV